MAWELSFLEWLQTYATADWLSQILRVITISCDVGLIWIITGIVMLFFKKWRKCGIFVILAVLVVAGLCNNLIIKPSVARTRPFLVDSNLTMAETWFLAPHSSFLGIAEVPMGYSFMSGHATSSFAAATAIFLYHKKTGIIAYVYALIILWSRLYFGVHYPTDVIAGLIWGMLVTIGAFFGYEALYKLIVNKYQNYKNKRQNDNQK